MTGTSPAQREWSPLALWAAPTIFVLLWSSGYVVARLAVPHCPPLQFLALRFVLTCLVLGPMIVFSDARWPTRAQLPHVVIAGLLVHAGYLSGVWCAVRLGMPAGLAALIVNLQPVLTAVAAPWLGERVKPVQWAGLAVGFAGVALVVGQRVSNVGFEAASLSLAVFALIAITAGTLYQKRNCPDFDLRTGTLLQYGSSAAVVVPLAWWFEADQSIDWHPDLIVAFVWSVLALSIGAIFLMYRLIARGAATRVASLFYLVPPVTAAMAWLLFREPFGWLSALGMALTAAGVLLVQKR